MEEEIMGRVSDMAIGLEEEARDELLCEIDHWKARATKVERLLVLSAFAHEAMCNWVEFELNKAGIDDDGMIGGAREAIADVRAYLAKATP
jgi:hypothetical protein